VAICSDNGIDPEDVRKIAGTEAFKPMRWDVAQALRKLRQEFTRRGLYPPTTCCRNATLQPRPSWPKKLPSACTK
jgi:hypothetical protein